jgi:outer membrane protein
MRVLPSLIATVLFTGCCIAAEIKVATVDMQRLLSEYHRAQEVARQLREKQGAFQKELEGLRLEGRRLATETEELNRLSQDSALNASERDARRKALEGRLVDLRAFDVKYDNARAQREAELQALAAQNNKRILDEVMTATRAVGDREGLNLILNASRANPLASDVLYSKNVADVTDKVLASLNKDAGGK